MQTPAKLAACLAAALVLSAFAGDASAARTRVTSGRIPVVYCTDLFHPHDDPDDHFDLATICAIPELDLRAVVLDQGDKQLDRPGAIPVAQINRLTGRTIPAVIGLARPLRDPNDQALEQPARFQEGVDTLLRVLRESSRPVMIAAVGSLRDVVAAFNRAPALFRRQVGKVLVFIGEASDPAFREYNVALDPQAFIGLLRSDLPVYWVPCFDGGLWQNRGHASFWQAKHETLLREGKPGLLQYFIYALERETAEPLSFLDQPVNQARQARLFAGVRNLWCTAIFGELAGQTVAQVAGEHALIKRDPHQPEAARRAVYGFEPVEVWVDEQAVVHYGARPGAHKVLRFNVLDASRYPAAMTSATAALLRSVGR